MAQQISQTALLFDINLLINLFLRKLITKTVLGLPNVLVTGTSKIWRRGKIAPSFRVYDGEKSFQLQGAMTH